MAGAVHGGGRRRAQARQDAQARQTAAADHHRAEGQRHRHQEFVRFLNTIEAQVPAGKVIHAIVDNYATHKHPKVRQWLARHPRWTFHFTPTSASWLNAVEGFFAKLTRQRLKRGVFRSVVDLQLAINRFVADTNADPKPFTWTADPKRVLASVKRGKQTLESVH
jgi:transposase